MPPLRFFGRWWHFGSDDLLLPESFCALLQLVNIILCADPILANVDNPLKMWLFIAGGTSVCAIAIDLSCCFVSSRGAIFDGRRRAALPALLWMRTALALIQFILLVLCTLAIPETPDSDGKSAAKVCIILDWIFVSFLGVIILSLMSTRGSSGEVLLKMLQRLISCLGWSVGCGMDDECLRLVEDVTSTFFQNSNATISDVIAAQLLLGRLQLASRLGVAVPPLSALHLDGFPWGDKDQELLFRSCGGALPSTAGIVDRATLDDILHNLCFTTAVYGWKFYAYVKGGRFCSICSCRRRPVGGSMNRRAVEAFLKEWPGHENSQLVYFKEENRPGLTPYALFADHAKRNVVLAIRGSDSISDYITDCAALPEKITDPTVTGPSPGPHYVHAGMMLTARKLLQELKDSMLLETLLDSREDETRTRLEQDAKAFSHDLQQLPNCCGYGLIVIGHSLGSGVAQLLTALLLSSRPCTRCIAYSAPGVCSEAMAQHLSGNTLTLILGDDIVPRLSVRSMELLRDRMLAYLAHCPLPKHRLFWRCLSASRHTSPEEFLTNEPVSDEAISRLRAKSGRTASPRFYHAGRICYLRVLKSSEKRRCCCCCPQNDVDFQAEWADTDDFQEVLMSRSMLLHHLPDRLRCALDKVLDGHGHAFTTYRPGKVVPIYPTMRIADNN